MTYWLERMYPFFSQVHFAVSEDPEYEGGSCYVPESDENPAAVILMGGDVSAYEKLKGTRPDAMTAVAKLLGTTVERLDGPTIEAFIFFHEAGHLYDYFVNFGAANEELGYTEVTALWAKESEAQLRSLPIPGWSPSDLRYEIDQHGGLAAWRAADAEFDAQCRHCHADSVEELIRIQERAYRSLPKEAFADEFAAKEMKAFFRSQHPGQEAA